MGLACVALATTLAGLTACSLSGPVRTDAKAAEYTLARLPAPWRLDRVDPNVDYSFINPEAGSLLSVSSTCRRYDDVTLEALMKDIVRPIDGAETLVTDRRMLDGREALYRKVRGKMDGVDIEAALVVLRKDDCIFDFSLFTREALRAADERAFTGFLEAFHYEGGTRP